jgi:hypothetical protein
MFKYDRLGKQLKRLSPPNIDPPHRAIIDLALIKHKNMRSIGPQINNQVSLALIPINITIKLKKQLKERINPNHHRLHLIRLKQPLQQTIPTMFRIGPRLRHNQPRPNLPIRLR